MLYLSILIIIALQIRENCPAGYLVGNLRVSDPDNINGDKQFYTCEVVNDVPFKVWRILFLVFRRLISWHVSMA